MIYTVTFNPAIDYAIGVENLEPGMTNRSTFEQLLPGGKGLNVSTILNHLGMENTALGFIAGFTGAEIKRSFEAFGGKSDFIELREGISRINVKIKSVEETEINAAGPVIDKEAVEQLMEKLDQLKEGDILILAGSIPSSMSDSLYSDIMKMLSDRDIMIAVDATKDLLLNVMPYKPFLVKPNNHELGEIFGVTLNKREEVVPYAKKLQEKGARNVLISMAGEGAVLIAENGEVFMSEAQKGDYAHAFKMGLSAGSASAFSELLATKQEIEQVYHSFELL